MTTGEIQSPRQILGVDIGGTKTAIVVGTEEAKILERFAFPSRANEGFETMFSEICRQVGKTLEKYPSAGSISVSVGGPMDAETGTILGPPNLPGWDNVPLKALLGERFSRPVYVEHDAKAGALAEWKFGAGRGAQNLVFLTLGTGLGAGIILGGRLVRGAGNAAGEVGHWRIAPDGPEIYGKRGSWEGYSSGAGIAALARHRHPEIFHGDVTALQVAEMARNAHPEACQILRTSGEYLGRGLALLIDALAPEVIVLGSLAYRIGDLLLPPALEVVQREVLPGTLARCRIVPGQLGESLGDVAALCAALCGDNR